MIIERHEPLDLFALLPKLRLEMEPELAQLDRLLEDDVLFGRVKADLCLRHPNSATCGRRSTPIEVILRMLVVKRLYGWSYQETERFVSDSIVLRQFCRLYLEPAPDDTTLIRWANLIGSDTLEELNARVVELARTLKITRGRKLRTDGTVVETNVHYRAPHRSNLQGQDLKAHRVWPQGLAFGGGRRHRELLPHTRRQSRRCGSDSARTRPACPPVRGFATVACSDRGCYSPDNERLAAELEVKRVCLPRPGRKTEERRKYKHQRWFKRGQRFRAGSEGRISVLKRQSHLGRCRDHGEEGFGRWVGWGILTANLSTIARHLA